MPRLLFFFSAAYFQPLRRLRTIPETGLHRPCRRNPPSFRPPAAAHYTGNRIAPTLQEKLAAFRPPAAPHYPGNRIAQPLQE